MAKKRHLKKKNKMMTANVIENETREDTKEVTKEVIPEAASVQTAQAEVVQNEESVISVQKTAETDSMTTGTAAKKRASKKTNFYVQFRDAEYNEQDIIAQVKKIWKDAGNRIADLKTMDVYVKPEEKMVYYTINEELSASFAL
ncbi:DUF6465 family protein [Robinsoniella peoriensis]|uniref:Uncharacterized protein n=1 Tax=Robinsoniella peoriensis TaxID=180332 RepID=A0A4U8QSD4_9FIRM|nr:DUF6465 family protein [Robinsoniella peoriensis]MDU7026229.1 DUF6465 family protein [Clostridiales bacterium]TLD03016.1 hypothetical protein DSM106044_00040 [Robinsoniella peoriensis]